MSQSSYEKNDDNIIDGKYLSKPELKSRLIQMNMQLDKKDHKKEYYVDLYNKLVLQYERRMLIKSIIETDIIDNPTKILNKKRARDETENTPNFHDGSADKHPHFTGTSMELDDKRRNVSNINTESKLKEDMEYETLKTKSLNINSFMEKIEKGLKDYKTKFHNQVEGGASNLNQTSQDIQMEDANLLSFSKDTTQDRRPRAISNLTFARNSVDAGMFINDASNKELLQSINDNLNPVSAHDIQKKLHYAEDENEHSNVYKSSSDEESVIIPVRGHIEQPKKQPFISSHVVSISGKKQGTEPKRSLPGSSTNIRDILKKVDSIQQETFQKSSNSISPRPFIAESAKMASNTQLSKKFASDRSNPKVMMSNRELKAFKSISNKSIRSLVSQAGSQIVVNVRPTNISEFSKDENVVVAKSNNWVVCLKYIILGAGLILISYYFLNYLKQNEMLKFDLGQIDIAGNIQYIVPVLFITISALIMKKMMNARKMKKIADGDFQLVKNILKSNYANEEFPLGLFENNLIKDFSKNHKLSEDKYKKHVLPMLQQLRKKDSKIIEADVLIQGQSQKVWKLEDNN